MNANSNAGAADATPSQAGPIRSREAALAKASDLLYELQGEGDPAVIQARLDHFLLEVDPAHAFAVAGLMALAQPFYIPAMDPAIAARLELSQIDLGEALMRARLTARQSPQPNVLVACMPKSASSFLTTCLRQALDLPLAVLMAGSLLPTVPYAHGITLRDQETDDLGLLLHGNNRRGFVAQHHVRCTPYLCRQLEFYNIRPIVTHRNIFDSLVSLDDMHLKHRKKRRAVTGVAGDYFQDGLPLDYCEMCDEERYNLLVDIEGHWYLQFYLSWRRCEALGLVRPLWVSYERDIKGDPQALAERICTFLDRQSLTPGRLAPLLAARDAIGSAGRFNKGVTGRGAHLPEAVTARIRALFAPYRQELDWSALLAEPQAPAAEVRPELAIPA